jgi:hypothetical protein
MIVYKRWIVVRKGNGFAAWLRTGDVRALQCQAEFEGWFLFGVVPLFIRQRTEWM